jgi:predicted PurR-regulated permease PerM
VSAANRRERYSIDVPWSTIFKLIAAVALVWLWLQLYELVLVVAVALILSVALHPVVSRVERFGLPRWLAATGISFLIAAAIAFFVWATWSQMTDQATYLAKQLDETGRHVITALPSWMRDAVESSGGTTATSFAATHLLALARSVSYAVTITVLAFILMVYLLIEGRQTRDWLLGFAPRSQMPRISRTFAASQTVIYGYVAGNVITSICATVFMLVVFTVLGVPAALLLALLTGLFDVIPVIGSIIPAIPAVLLALTVSTTTAVLVVVAHIVYNSIENYLIGPWAYGGRLRLSNLAVILALVVGGELGGVIGALIALPIAALYPAIEQIWLRDEVGEDTIRRHRAVEGR